MDNLYVVKEFTENSTVFSCIIDGKVFEKIIDENLDGIFNVSDIISDETLLTLEKNMI